MPSLITCGILTVSDSCFNKKKEDVAGPKLAKALQEAFPTYEITFKEIVPDDIQEIINTLNKWISLKCTIILTTGGTGFSPRDVTPEATRAVIEREAPGIAFAMLTKSLHVTPMAMLSRAVCGIRDKSIVINLPGSAKGALECFSFIRECIPHAVAVLTDKEAEVARDHQVIQSGGPVGPSKVATDNVADRPRHSTFPMLEVEDAVNLILQEAIIPERTEEISIEKALHRVLAEDVLSNDNIPPFDASIKDGYAVLAADGAGPRKIRSFLAAGDAPNLTPLQAGQAIRIGTGAPIPAGADAVVQVEDTQVLSKFQGEEIEININKAPVAGQDIRRLGCDVAKNTAVLMRGERLRAPHVGVLAAIGKSRVTVYKPPSVGIITTGNELREHFEDLKPGQIRDSNRLALINLLREYDYTCKDYGIVRDEPNCIKKAILQALTDNDILITTGGVSMGEFDFIKRVLTEDFEATVHFGRVNMKPGKPTTFATLILHGARKLVFGLPGNPVSASVTCLLFVIPTIRYLEKAASWTFPILPYTVTSSKPNPDPRPEYVRVVVKYEDGKIVAKPNGGQISSRLNSLIGANGLMLLPASMSPNQEYKSKIILIGELLTS